MIDEEKISCVVSFNLSVEIGESDLEEFDVPSDEVRKCTTSEPNNFTDDLDLLLR